MASALIAQPSSPSDLQQIVPFGQIFIRYHDLLHLLADKITDFLSKNKDLLKQNTWSPPEDFRSRFHLLYQAHVASVIDTFFKDKMTGPVLELGAGYPIYNQQSYLASCLPPSVQWDLTFQDESEDIHQSALSSKTIKFMKFNSTETSSHVAPSSLMAVISSCFLDTLYGTSLDKTLQEIYKVIQNGGLFFHISDVSPFFNTLVYDHRDGADIAFPHVDEGKYLSGLQLIPRIKCEEFIKRCEGSPNGEFLKTYIALDPFVRAKLIIEICSLNMPTILSKWIEQTFPNDRKCLPNSVFFKSKIEKALKDTKFKVLKCGLERKELTAPRSAEDFQNFNDILAMHGRCMKLNQANIPEGSVRKSSIVHIIVLQKVEEKP